MRVSLTLLVVAAAFAVALINPRGSRAQPLAAAQSAAGALSISNSAEGRAILNAGGLRPGATIHGTVTIGNAGQVAGRFSVRPSGLTDTPGPGGGALSQRLQLQLADVTDPAHPQVVFAGTPAALSAVELGNLAAGVSRTYELTATMPSGSDDNLFQGAGLSLGLEWIAIATATATPTPTPTAPTTTAPVAPAPTTPAKAPSADALGLPSAKRCLGKQLKVRVRTPDKARLVSGKLRAGRRSATATARKPVAVLKRLPAGRVTITIKVRTAAGHTYQASRKYKRCGKRR